MLGFLVARIEGKPLGQVLQERIFGPLGMTDTFFWCPPEKRDRMAKLYRIDPDDRPAAGRLLRRTPRRSRPSRAAAAG